MRCSSNNSKFMVTPFLGKLFWTVARLQDRRQRQVSGKEKPPGTKEGNPGGLKLTSRWGGRDVASVNNKQYTYPTLYAQARSRKIN
jgi:hypothetical protein